MHALADMGPDYNNKFVMNNGLTIPIGQIISHNRKGNRGVVGYPEYVVYDVDQVRIRYLLQIKD